MIRRFTLLATGLAIAVAMLCLSAPLHAETGANAPLKPVLTTFNVMDYLVDPAFEILEEAMESEPADRRGWRDIRRSSETLAEVSNLLLFRDDLEYIGSQEWVDKTVAMRTAAEAVTEASKSQNFAETTAAYAILVQSCNACHARFEPDTAPTFPIPGE